LDAETNNGRRIFLGKHCQKLIMENKDLDLPTQRQLLAQYRCAEIAKVCRPPVLLALAD